MTGQARVPNYIPRAAAYLTALQADGMLLATGDVLDVNHDSWCAIFASGGICDCEPMFSLRRGLSIEQTAQAITESWREIRAVRRARET